MTSPSTQPPVENVVAGSILALIVIPVGAALIAVISNVGFYASFVSFAFALGAVWLYRAGSGGVISRMGAWIVTAIVAVTIVVGIWLSMVVGYAGGLGKLHNLTIPGFWAQFNGEFPALLSQQLLFVLLTLGFGALGAFRTLRRAFLTAHVTRRPDYFPRVQPPSPPTYTAYRNDVDATPTGSADDKTAPPSSG